MNNINTKSYWDNRFITGDWETKGGRNQTRNFAITQVRHLNIEKNFNGTLLDFGCGLGDAFPIYKKSFPQAKFIGLDISIEAINRCNKHYGHIADFICGTFKDVPTVDIIIASNVFEHLIDDKEIARELMQRCQRLFIIVPYKEQLLDNPKHEHINSYQESSFNNLPGNKRIETFFSMGWGPSGIDLYFNIYFKNIGRSLLGRNIAMRPKQILFALEK